MTGRAGSRALQPAGRAPRAMLARIARALERAGGLRRAAAWLAELADAPSVLSGQPLTGASLGALVDDTATRAAAVENGTGGHRTIPTPDITTRAARAMAGVPARPQDARRARVLPAPGATAPTPALPAGPRVDSARLRAWAGSEVSTPARAVHTAPGHPPAIPRRSGPAARAPAPRVAPDATAVRDWAGHSMRRAALRLDPAPAYAAAHGRAAVAALTHPGGRTNTGAHDRRAGAGTTTRGWDMCLEGPTAPGALIARLAGLVGPEHGRTARGGDDHAAPPTERRRSEPPSGPAAAPAAAMLPTPVQVAAAAVPAPARQAPADASAQATRTLAAPSQADRSRQRPLPPLTGGRTTLPSAAAPVAPDSGFAGAGELDDLAEKITRILNDEARRHGLSL